MLEMDDREWPGSLSTLELAMKRIETERRMTDRRITFVVITKVAKRSHRAFFGV
jgi:hypothetical protein